MTGTSSVASSGVRTSVRSESQTCGMRGPAGCAIQPQKKNTIRDEWQKRSCAPVFLPGDLV